MPDDYGVTVDTLTNAAKQISDFAAPVNDLDIESQAGDGGAYGNDELFGAFATFCTTWQVGASALGMRAESASDGLVQCAETYSLSDEDAQKMIEGAQR
ncbi:hypothetical protein D5S17_33790 [Pseudonocardiaceae bacterium YIM PH 21723]|nr:hypothetical protein D5S17_33790 [Pseudonocardiaceae bacterium YIM PH 21723]